MAKLELRGVVKSLSKVPYAATKYDCVVSLKAVKDAPVPAGHR